MGRDHHHLQMLHLRVPLKKPTALRLAAQGEARSATLCDREAGDTICGVPERQLKEASVVATAASTAGFGGQHGRVR